MFSCVAQFKKWSNKYICTINNAKYEVSKIRWNANKALVKQLWLSKLHDANRLLDLVINERRNSKI